MTDTRKTGWRRFGGGMAISLLLHCVAVAVFLFSFDSSSNLAEEEEAVEVTLVMPPVEPESASEPQDEVEAPPEPAPPEEPAAPEEPQAAAAPPPSAPPPPAAPPPPETVPTPAERPADQPPVEAAGEALSPAPTLPMLRPVVQFGDKDAGPREETSGDSAEEAAKPADPPSEEEVPPDAAQEPAAAESESESAEDAPGTPLPDDIALPEIDTGEAGADDDGAAPADKPAETRIALATDMPPAKPAPAAAGAETPGAAQPAAPKAPPLEEVKELYSTSLTGDAAAMTAMSDIPRPDRADQLCVTELREQLRRGQPAYRPELLPSFRLKEGNVLTVNKAAFRAAGQWFDLRFRCEIDADATRVLSFAYEVGRAIPKSEWKRYGFPEF